MARGANIGGAPKKQRSNPPAKKTASNSIPSKPADDEGGSNAIPLDLQQKCLDIFREAFRPTPEDAPLLQEVKGYLYRRDFSAAFGKDEHLRVYASRWSPSRALGYLQVFEDLSGFIGQGPGSGQLPAAEDALRMVFLGGGAGGELVAAGAWLSRLCSNGSFRRKIEIDIIDVADWTNIIDELVSRIMSPPEISKYASQAKKEANRPLLAPESLRVGFEKKDLFEMSEKELQSLVEGAQVVTLMFILNELYSASLPKTQRYLQSLKRLMRPGALLLVVDSPGSYSAVSFNGTEKKYPMQWLLDYMMLGSPEQQATDQGVAWQKLVSDDSRWFRVPQELRYPIELENMRYQIHLLKRSDEVR